MRAPMVVADGSRPDSPTPWAQAKTSGGHLIGQLARAAKEVLQHARVALDRAHGAGAALLLGEECVHGTGPTFGGVGELG